MSWEEYFKQTKNKKISPLLKRAVELSKRGKALDIGAGNLVDSVYLAEQGFEVTAIDSSKDTKKYSVPQVSLVISPVEQFTFKKYSLVSAQYSLPFVNSKYIDMVWDSIINSLQKGGIFVGQFFGVEDDWANPKHFIRQEHPHMTFFDREKIDVLLKGLEVIEIDEEKTDRKTASGDMKHWHIFHIITRKPLK